MHTFVGGDAHIAPKNCSNVRITQNGKIRWDDVGIVPYEPQQLFDTL
ncbi:MAG: hypothetical protein LBM98_04460 [Oscillospiraceae bacterium]|nr:hypothetical protein [Oscillospiraceae bacterium]